MRGMISAVIGVALGGVALGSLALGGLAAAADDAARQLAAFAGANRVAVWPRLAGCGYAPSLGDGPVGLIVRVAANGTAEGRWDGTCHVPIRHHLLDWPAALPPGRYVVAARSESDRRTLRVLAVLGDRPDAEPLLEAALDRICSGAGAETIPDRDCATRQAR